MRAYRIAFIALPGLFLCAGAWAIEPADHLNVQEPALPEYLPLRPADSFQLPPVALPPAPAAEAAPARNLDRIVFRGNRAIGTEDLERAAGPWLGTGASPADLEALRIRLTRVYVERGFVNSGALITAGAFNEGTLTVDIVEGRLSSMELAGLGDLDEQYVVAKLVPDPEAPLNVDALRERYLLLLDDPLILRMSARLMPGAALGEAVLGVDVERAPPWHVGVEINNHRPASIGEFSVGIAGGLRNLTGRGDALDIRLQSPLEAGGKLRTGVGWRVPLNYAGTELSMQVDQGESAALEEPLRTLDVRSRLASREIGISQLVSASLSQRLALGLDYQARRTRTWLGGQPFSFVAGEPVSGTRSRSWRFWQEYTHRTEHQVLALRSTFSWSRNNLQPASFPQAGPDQRHRAWLGQFQYARRLTADGVQGIVRASLQTTPDRLLSIDGMSIGGNATVRGYRENQLIRDRGQVVNLELDIPVVRIPQKQFSLSVVPFIDHGRGRNRAEAQDKLSSAGVALRGRWGQLTLDVARARRFAHSDLPPGSRDSLQDKGVHIRLAYVVGGK